MSLARLDGKGRLPDLAEVLRAAGLPVDESVVPDWRLRSRGGNTQWYKDGLPSHLMLHDTATPASTHRDLASERREASRFPVHPDGPPCSNLYIGGTTGTCFPIAAGPANTNGAGSDWWAGGVPKDSMNTYSIAIEYGNDGVGEPWQEGPWEIYMRASAAIVAAYGIPIAHVRCHYEWAPTRKINLSSGPNPAGAAVRFARPGDRYGRFDMDKVRAHIASLGAPAPVPPSDPEGDDEMYSLHEVLGPDGQPTGSVFAWSGGRYVGVPGPQFITAGAEQGHYSTTQGAPISWSDHRALLAWHGANATQPAT